MTCNFLIYSRFDVCSKCTKAVNDVRCLYLVVLSWSKRFGGKSEKTRFTRSQLASCIDLFTFLFWYKVHYFVVTLWSQTKRYNRYIHNIVTKRAIQKVTSIYKLCLLRVTTDSRVTIVQIYHMAFRNVQITTVTKRH